MDLVANPIGLSRTPPRYERRPPRLGKHTDEIKAWLDGSAMMLPGSPERSYCCNPGNCPEVGWQGYHHRPALEPE